MPDPTIITAFIGATGTAVGAVLGATIPALLDARRDRQRFSQASLSRKSALVGFWRGEGKDSYADEGGDFMEFKIEARFRENSNKLTADANLILPHPDLNTALILTGGFYDDSYLQFTYQSKDPIRKQMGVVVLRLSEMGDRLEGHYAGFSPIRGKFVVGEVTLRAETAIPAR